MEFVLGVHGDCYEVRLVGAHHDLSVQEALRLDSVESVTVDGRAVSAERAFASVARPGSVVDVDGGADPTAAPAGDHEVMGRRPFNRPPRSEFPVALPPIPAPVTREAPRSGFRFGWTALVVPVVLGIVLAIAIHPRMALFAVFSPAMAFSNWIEDRRRLRKGVKANSEQLRDDLAEFQTKLVAAVAAETRLRLRAHPGPEELMRWVEVLDSRLWERRRHHEDVVRLGVGTACVGWSPDLLTGYDAPAPEATALIEQLGVLHDVPVPVALDARSIVGISGPAAARRALARSLVIQAVTLHGPSDVRLTIVTDHPQFWDWAKWLPHVLVDAPTGRRRLAGSPAESAEVLAGFAAPDPTIVLPGSPVVDPPHEVLLVDVDDLAHPVQAPVRDAIERAATGRGAVVTLAPSVNDLSSRSCVVLEIDRNGNATMRIPDRGVRVDGIAPWGTSVARARRTARRLAGLIDPDESDAAADLPTQVRLVDLLGMAAPTPDAIGARWDRNAGSDPSVPVGTTPVGPFGISLVSDGPHALLAGTTGAGKSEFLRSLVASLAASSSPDDLTFVLVDYKGGSAFDVCARLPHTVGLVTDLDGHLAQRALSCLEAELRHREEQLRAVGAADLGAYRAGGADRPLPRLFVVVDEFAALAKELPEFMTALIDVAQRGRSLGVHLLLATQRPQGVINDQIRANTNLRIALRVQDAADSSDVIGTAEAANIGRAQAGRGFVRLGAGDVQPFQAALVTGPSTGPADPELRPFVFGPEQPAGVPVPVDADAPTDLDVLVAAITGAYEQAGIAPPRRPWPDPLPGEVAVSTLPIPDQPMRTTFGLADEPSRQRQRPVAWGPTDGSLILYGVAGSGTTTAMATLGLGLAANADPNDLHFYILDFDDQLLAPLRDLPHTGGVVGPSDRERQIRLIRMLQRQIDERRQVMATDPAALAELPIIVLMIDNYAGFAAAFDEPADLAVKSALARIIADGPGVGIVSVITAKQPVDVPAQVSSLIPAKLLFRLTDRYEYAGLGVSGVEPPTQPGRCYESWTGREVHIAVVHPDGPGAAVALLDAALALERPPSPVGTLPEEVKVSQLVEAASVFDLEWTLPVGLGDAELAPAGFRIGEGDHVVISGPARSGKSTALATLAQVAKAARSDVHVVAVSPRRSPLRDCTDVDTLLEGGEGLRAVVDAHELVLILVDDAAMVDDTDGILAELSDRPRSGAHVVAAAPTDLLRSAYGHWTAGLRRSRIGLALKPNPSTDGDLWQTALPRRGPARFAAGRGYLVAEGQCELVQVAST